MATCNICDGEMLEVAGCNHHIYLLKNGNEVKPVCVGTPSDASIEDSDERCGDCNASIGETHHIGCDQEVCRLCGGQFIGCDCDYSNEMLVIEMKGE